VKDTYGLNLALAAVDLPKATWYYHQNDKVDYEEKYVHLRAILEAIARKYPEYGLPRIMAELQDAYHCHVNHKVVGRLLGLWDLCILRGTRRRKPSGVQRAILEVGEQANLVAQMEEIGLFQVLYTDFTELLYADGHRKAILMPIIGHASKIAFGWAVGESDDTNLALQAWERAKETFQKLNTSYAGKIMHHDRDPVYTGYGWTSQLLLKDGLRVSYALRGAKDNPEPATSTCSGLSPSTGALRPRGIRCSWRPKASTSWSQLWMTGCATTTLSGDTLPSAMCRR